MTISVDIPSNTIVIIIKGLETHNEKHAKDRKSILVPSRVASRRFIALPSGYQKRVKKHRALASMFVTTGTTLEQRKLLSSGCTCLLVRIGPKLLYDVSESARAALAAVRDGVADALGVDDRDASMGGWIDWDYAQERGPYAVRIELTPCSLPAPRLADLRRTIHG